MCLGGILYLDEDEYQQQKDKEKFYNKRDEEWDYYSGLPGVMSYDQNNK
jgi:hypothetical protein